MTFMKNHLGILILRFAVVAVLMMGVVAPGFAARIDKGTPAKPASTMTSPSSQTAPQPPAPATPEKSQPVSEAPQVSNVPATEQAASAPQEPTKVGTETVPSSIAAGQETILR
ncbi:MAG TPA: hypothetical protein P5347_02975, partial [Smithellaceae bacterium]|nr:hypothetical protein [Smithellaceae bacterium]